MFFIKFEGRISILPKNFYSLGLFKESKSIKGQTPKNSQFSSEFTIEYLGRGLYYNSVNQKFFRMDSKPWICRDSELEGRELGGNTVGIIWGYHVLWYTKVLSFYFYKKY